MSYLDPQNPGIGGLRELTTAEETLIQNLAALTDPDADRILFWDDSAGEYDYLIIGSGLTITDKTITSSGGIGGSGTANEISYWVNSSTLGTLAVATYPSLTEVSYVKGVTSAIQAQLNGKAATLSGTINEIAYFNSASTIASLAVATYPSLAELSYVKGVTSAIQTQLNGKQASGSYEVTTNKVTSISGASTDTQYPSAKLLYDQLALKSPLASPTFTGTVTTPAIKITTGAGLGKVLTSDADGDATWETPSAGSALWTLMSGTPTRVGNTSFTVTGDITTYVAKGMIIKWTESGTVRVAMVSIPSTYGAPNTTITIIGDTMASIDASSLKYCMLGVEMFQKNFAVAGNIGATGTDVANAYYATEPMRVLGADLQVGTAGTTNSTTIDINIAGTTCFTTKPTLATTVAASPTPFTADTATALTLNQRVSIDIDAIQTTNAIDLYVNLYVIPTRYTLLS